MLRQIRNKTIKTVTTGVIVFGTLEITTNLPSEGRSSMIYHKLADEVATPLMRRLLNPEDAHNFAVYAVSKGLGPTFRPNSLENSRIDLSSQLTTANAAVTNLTFPNCIGLAAGFDKDGVAVKNLMDLGFGFVEVGSVTPRAQPGNPKPRMFRLVEDGAVINRFGFNSVGLDEVEKNLIKFYEQSDSVDGGDVGRLGENGIEWIELVSSVLRKVAGVLFSIPVSSSQSLLGVNLGKNKTSTAETEDYEVGIQKLGPYADYIVINISSPNTPGLRDLQKNEPLRRLLRAAIRQRDNLILTDKNGTTMRRPSTTDTLPPLFVKISPDNTNDQLKDICSIALECGVDGIIVTNTTNARPSTLRSSHSEETGGLSGAPLKDRSTECVRQVYRHTNGQLFIVGIGGVASGQDAYEKLRAGATVVQLYSGMVYGGPGLVSRIRKELAEVMLENGQKRVEDVIGLDHDDIYWEKRLERTREGKKKETVIVNM